MKTKKIEDQIKDPIVMKKIIDTILDPKNPDSNKINKEIIKNIASCISKDDAFLTTVKGMVIENATEITKQTVTKCMDDSKEYLTNAMVSVINMRCEEYLKEQRRIISNAVRKTLDKCVDEIIKTTRQSIDKNSKKLQIKEKLTSEIPGMVAINVPSNYKNQVLDYVSYLKFSNDKIG